MSRSAMCICLGLIAASCTSLPAPTIQPSAPVLAAGPTSPSATVPGPSTRPTEVASSSELPSGGGTCSATQIVLGTATYDYGFGTFFTTSVSVTQPLRDIGGDCILHLPALIGVAPATGAFEAVAVGDAGTENGTGGYTPAMSAKIPSGRSLSIVIGAWWWSGARPDTGTPFPAPPCAGPINEVTRVEFPLATGTLHIDLPVVLKQVCSSTASMSLTIKNG